MPCLSGSRAPGYAGIAWPSSWILNSMVVEHLAEMPEQTETGDVSASVNVSSN